MNPPAKRNLGDSDDDMNTFKRCHKKNKDGNDSSDLDSDEGTLVLVINSQGIWRVPNDQTNERNKSSPTSSIHLPTSEDPQSISMAPEANYHAGQPEQCFSNIHSFSGVSHHRCAQI